MVLIDMHSALTYKLDAGKLQLDHLEANVLNSSSASNYYLYTDIEKRQKDVNGYIGNFMILDAVDNNQKNNVPLCKAMSYYSKINKSWLVEDIKGMILDNDYFDVTNKIPKESFFIERSKRLKKYFKAILNRQFNQNKIDIYL